MLALDGGPVLTDRELTAIVKLVYARSGITLHDGKRALVTARLQKRLRAGGFDSFSAYLRHVEADRTGAELSALLDAIATNHTSFYREPQHFAFLRRHVLAGVTASGCAIWSAACSTGEEPYTIAMEVVDHVPAALRPHVRILASDLSTKALRTAEGGVYKRERIADLPPDVLRRHFERGLGEQAGLVRVAPAPRKLVQFRQQNLLEPIRGTDMFDAIFCRNVMIYFDRAVQQRVVTTLESRIKPGGYLFISHSESLNGVTHGLKWIAPAVYPEACMISAARPPAPAGRRLVVGIGESAVSDQGGDVIVTHALGSCIAVCIWDPTTRVAGMLHFLLPESRINPERARVQPGTFADTGLPLLFAAAYAKGLQKRHAVVKLVGGADVSEAAGGAFNVGRRNTQIARQLLWKNGLLIRNEAVGGTAPRTVTFFVDDGRLQVSSAHTQMVVL